MPESLQPCFYFCHKSSFTKFVHNIVKMYINLTEYTTLYERNSNYEKLFQS